MSQPHNAIPTPSVYFAKSVLQSRRFFHSFRISSTNHFNFSRSRLNLFEFRPEEYDNCRGLCLILRLCFKSNRHSLSEFKRLHHVLCCAFVFFKMGCFQMR